MTADVIVVGTGPSGAMAALTLVERGIQPMVLDVGRTGDPGQQRGASFMDLRRSEPSQHTTLLGERFEGLPKPAVRTGAQLTPPRRHLLDLVDRLLAVEPGTFSPLETLAYGGLGSAWGCGCCVFSDAELERTRLPVPAMRGAYRWVASRIGISGLRDDAAAYTAGEIALQPPVETDPNASALLRAWERRKDRLKAKGISVGRTALAVLTEPLDGREPYAYRDMDWYDDIGRSAYRPWITIDALRANDRIEYMPDAFVTAFSEHEGEVEVSGLRPSTGEPFAMRCRRLVLAAGTLGTSRIVLRSTAGEGSVPLLCNAYSYFPAIQPRLLGKPAPDRRCGFAQVAMFHDADGTNTDVAMASLYAYRSLMLFRLVRELPFNLRDATALLRELTPAMTIMGVHHPDAGSPSRSLRLAPADTPTGDALHVDFAWSDAEREAFRARERSFTGALRALGAWTLRRVDPGPGASIHYAGTLPFSESERPRSLAPDGRLHGTRRVYVADGSGFTYLPAKGLTLSLMANAHAVAGASMA